MPEGPEIRRAADRLGRVLTGQTPENVELLLPGLARHAAKIRGQRIVGVQPRSKALLIHFDGGHSLYSHNQLYGRWYVVRTGKTPRTGRSLRLLDPETTLADLRAHVEDERFRRRSLASLLLDQAFLAGLGNYLRSEILYVATLPHDVTLGAIGAEARQRLADTAFALTRQAYRHRGVTNDLELVDLSGRAIFFCPLCQST